MNVLLCVPLFTFMHCQTDSPPSEEHCCAVIIYLGVWPIHIDMLAGFMLLHQSQHGTLDGDKIYSEVANTCRLLCLLHDSPVIHWVENLLKA
uniref:Putative secreted protein n=1 Tax=Amblyomma triste TaxID=251400 RepID=A0A023G3S6_AMBTT